jgi:muconolactone delta-isomerase
VEYLVTMTTHVPDGTPEADVDDVREREAAHSRELAAHGQLLRLWRPPVQPGEWRSLGLFAASDASDLEAVLASMPLRVWRTDEVTPLGPHPNDPGAVPYPASTTPAGTVPASPAAEFFTTFTESIPAGTPETAVAAASAREAARASELAGQGHLERLWTLPGRGRVLGLWRADNAAQLAAIVAALPLDAFMTTDTTPLSPHPSDPPAVAADRGLP